MIKDITLGQYFPGNSPLHTMDPRMKIILTILFIVMVFLAKSVSAFLLIIAFTVSLTVLSRIPVKIVLRGMKPLLLIILFTAFINIFWTRGEYLLVHFWIITIYFEGVMYAVMMMVRIAALLVGTSVILTYTTSPIALTDGLERLLSPLKKLKIPVHEFSMMMTIALRFIPTLIEEVDKIMNAQKARGADFSTGGITKRAKALIPVLVPLFISAFRRADELATAMECRCYRGGEGRTRMTERHLRVSDFSFLLLFCVVGGSLVFLNLYFPIYAV